MAATTCPVCRKECPPPPTSGGKMVGPFCSAACKVKDLEHWLSGTYRVPTDDSEGDLLGQADDRL